MDLNDAATREVFFDLYGNLPRAGPGNDASTWRALEIVGALPDRPRVLDIGCGPGMQTLALAERLPDAVIIGLDNHQPFLDRLDQAISARGLQDRVRIECDDMLALKSPERCIDLLWCEGAMYLMGVAQALRTWGPMLRVGGRIAFTEVVWTESEPPPELRAFWAKEYPEIGYVPETLWRIQRSGYRPMGLFHLPEEAWWEHYYTLHLSGTRETALQVGSRHGKPIVLEIDAGRMYADGHEFFLSANGIWLTDHVPAEYLRFEEGT